LWKLRIEKAVSIACPFVLANKQQDIGKWSMEHFAFHHRHCLFDDAKVRRTKSEDTRQMSRNDFTGFGCGCG